MAMNIKNEEAHKLAQELAALTGETLTAAVTNALQEKLERLRTQHDELANRLLSIGKNCAQHIKDPFESTQHGNLLYGEDGLPR